MALNTAEHHSPDDARSNGTDKYGNTLTDYPSKITKFTPQRSLQSLFRKTLAPTETTARLVAIHPTGPIYYEEKTSTLFIPVLQSEDPNPESVNLTPYKHHNHEPAFVREQHHPRTSFDFDPNDITVAEALTNFRPIARIPKYTMEVAPITTSKTEQTLDELADESESESESSVERS